MPAYTSAVLVVDDDSRSLNRTAEALDHAGHTVYAASHPSQAVELFIKQSDIGVIVTETSVSGTDGFAILRKLALHAEPGRRFKTIIHTSCRVFSYAVKAIEHQVDAFLCKPVAPDELIRRVDAAAIKLKQAQELYGWSMMAARMYSEIHHSFSEMFRRNYSDERRETSAFGQGDQSQIALSYERSRGVEELLKAARLRAKIFPEECFADPCWNMLLDLWEAETKGGRVSVSSLCIASGVPQSTALRRIADLERCGLVRRIKDPADGRRVFIELSDAGHSRIREYVSLLKAA